MTKAERRTRFEVAIEVANAVYSDMCRDPDVTKEHTREFCDILIQMQTFKCSLDPRPYDHENEFIP